MPSQSQSITYTQEVYIVLYTFNKVYVFPFKKKLKWVYWHTSKAVQIAYLLKSLATLVQQPKLDSKKL